MLLYNEKSNKLLVFVRACRQSCDQYIVRRKRKGLHKRLRRSLRRWGDQYEQQNHDRWRIGVCTRLADLVVAYENEQVGPMEVG